MSRSDDLFVLVLARCVGFTFRAPGFSHPSVPPLLRAGFAYVFALAATQGITKGVSLPNGSLLLGILCEMVLGAGIGMAATMLYDGAYAGGHVVDDYIGIKVNMPTAGLVAPSGFGRLWSEAFITAFFVTGGYGATITAFVHTFTALPPGLLLTGGEMEAFAYTLPKTLLSAAFLVAAPAVAVAFLSQFALACASRVVARLSVFSLSFTVVFICVLLITLVTLVPTMKALTGRGFLLQWDMPRRG